MGWKRLSTDYKDISWNGLKKYTQIDNNDGTISFRDDTRYINKESSFFGAKDANQINEAVNYIMAKLENGTDLYSAFQEFFTEQKRLFTIAKDEKIAEINRETALNYTEFKKYISELKEQGNTALTKVENDHRQRMSNYEGVQKALFELWFSEIKGNLSGDAAGKLQLLFEKLEEKTDGFDTKDVDISPDGNTITVVSGDKKIVTEVVSDTQLVKKLYVKNVLKKTKTTTFSENYTKVREIIE